MAKPHIVIGLSGGVDSAVSALLLKQQGYEVTAIFMKNWEDDDDGQYCSTRQDFIDAAAAADVIGIDFEAVNFAAEYKDRVFADFLREYSAGRTPNPDVLCNAEIKFKAFLDHALRLGAEKIATGHYAKVAEREGRYLLLRGDDSSKDQSYFLHRLNQYQLSKTLFPVGHLRKDAVRAIAREAGLPNHAKKDSTGICFIGERPFRAFLQQYLPRNPGFMVTPDGKRLGRHEGLMYYTLGQRQGLGIGGIKPTTHNAAAEQTGAHSAWYVAEKSMARNELVVVQGHDHALLQKSCLQAQEASWTAGAAPIFDITKNLGAKTRYRQTDAACVYAPADAPTDAPMQFGLTFNTPQWAVTPGQSAVLYQGDECLGGGIISS